MVFYYQKGIDITIIWNGKETLGLNDVLADSNAKLGCNWALQTVSTFMARLVKKGFLIKTKKGRFTCYAPVISLEDYRREKMKDMINLLYNGDTEAAKRDLKYGTEES